MDQLWLIMGIFCLSALKLLITPSIAVIEGNISLIVIAISSGLGASFGSILFFFLGKKIIKIIDDKFSKRLKKIPFTKNRRIISFKNKFNVFGVSMSIGVLSVPIGSILVAKYFSRDKKAIPSLIAASFIWAFFLTYFTALVSLIF